MSDHLSQYVEVSSPDGKVWRFAAGTKAGFAVSRIKSKLPDLARAVLCIEAVKEGEEPIEFGPDAELVRYGENWKLQVMQEQEDSSNKDMQQEKLGSSLKLEKVIADMQPMRVGTKQDQGVHADYKGRAGVQVQSRDIKDIIAELYPKGKIPKGSKQDFTFEYIGRVILSFGLIVLFAVALQFVLKSLPKL